MSYSFTVKADTKDDAGIKVEAALAEVVASQPSHASDRQAAQDAAEAFIDVLTEPAAGDQIVVSMLGSLSWRAPDAFTAASVSINAYIETKK